MKINLLNYRKSEYSDIGNDGIIEYIFKKLNIKEGTFVEFGAWDGIRGSNCRKLFDKGWSGIFIEADSNKYKKLKKNYKKHKNIICHKSRIDAKENLFDNVVDVYLKGGNIDFCSIDIDGRDLQVFETFKQYLPIVVCIEGGQMLYPFDKEIKNRIAKRNIHQSLKTTINVFEKKGYKILCCYQDCFFIKKEFYSIFNVSSDLLTLYFDGLKAIHRRIPFIQEYLGKVGLKNKIANYILERSKYDNYKWEKRKLWAKEKKDIIFELINEREKIEREKYG